MNAFTFGTLVRLTGTFSVGITPTDPTTVTFKMLKPDGAITTYVYPAAQVVKESSGVYHVDWPTAAEGVHTWRFEGTGTCVAAEEQPFVVRNSRFTP